MHILTYNLFSPLIDRVYNITSLVKVAMNNELNGSEKKERKGGFQLPDRQKKTQIMKFRMSSIEMLDLLRNDIHYLLVMQQNVSFSPSNIFVYAMNSIQSTNDLFLRKKNENSNAKNPLILHGNCSTQLSIRNMSAVAVLQDSD